jgi:uncharacterized protein YdeI (YjbR/CyaY-like superfamily)
MTIARQRLLMKSPELEIVPFPSPRHFERWLAKNHATSAGIWLQFFKKASGVKTVTYAQALDVALCYGWIDGQVKKFDEQSYLQRFTPRRSRSTWSKRNQSHVRRLIKEGRMQAAGLREVQAAKRDGRWRAAYNSPSKMKVPEDFLLELSKDPKAKAFFETLNRANLYAIAWRLQTATRAATREKRMRAILAMMARGEKFH